MAFNWTCPHCNLRQTVTDERFDRTSSHLGVQHQVEGNLFLERHTTGCANPDCMKTTVEVRIGPRDQKFTHSALVDRNKALFDARLIPMGAAQPQPDYIPQAIREDYHEACLIRDLSPKASATLIRRCLQGMIRDFAGIAKARLIDEIKALDKAVEDRTADPAITPETVKAIDHVRGIGNIGAHMEKDINTIVEVDSGEAQALIELVELLFEEWYVAREVRKLKLARIASIAQEKQTQKALPGPEKGASENEAQEIGAGDLNALAALFPPQRAAPDETA